MTAFGAKHRSSKEGEAHQRTQDNHRRNISFGSDDVKNSTSNTEAAAAETTTTATTAAIHDDKTPAVTTAGRPRSESDLSTSPNPSRRQKKQIIIHKEQQKRQPQLQPQPLYIPITTIDESNQSMLIHKRKSYMSTPNLLKLETNEYEYKVDGVGDLRSGDNGRNSTSVAPSSINRANKRSTTPIQNMKRSKSELILLSPEFRTRLINEQNERDPLFYYKVVKTIGNGSMGSVALVKKRSQTVGGSARKNVRQAVRTHKRKQECFKLPFGIGGLFRLCIEDELRVEEDPPLSIVKGKARRGGKNALLSIETWLGSSEGSSGVSSTSSQSQGIDGSDYSYDDDGSKTAGRSALGHEYAMKSIHLNRVNDDTFVQELKNEIAILKKLDHPHIVRPLETYHYRHQIFIVMEHCSGGDLYSRDPYTEEEAARIISSILSAVSYLHANNVAHRDLKYENILFVNTSPKAEIKLIDFGLSKIYGMGGTGPQLTEGVGTIYTMAPEVLKGSYTKQADVWSVGVIAYMLLSSQMPFYGRKRQHIVEQILGGKYDFRGRRWRKIGAPAKDFVRDLLVVDPDERLDAERASSCVWLNKRFSATVRGPKEYEIQQAKHSMTQYAGYTKLKKMALMVIAHRSTCEEIGILRKVFQKYASRDKGGCISYPEFNEAWKESGLPAEDTKAIFDAVVSFRLVGWLVGWLNSLVKNGETREIGVAAVFAFLLLFHFLFFRIPMSLAPHGNCFFFSII
jgi:serine/threonine protein kinase